jgi:hypothetical protein
MAMTNEIGGVGSRPGVGISSTFVAASAITGSSTSQTQSQNPDDSSGTAVEVGHSSFASILDAKARVTELAKAIRVADQVMGQADGLLNQMRHQLLMVKNYPPFPPGNEERLNFIKSIEGLRKEFEALSVPPADDVQKPVFYPKQSILPQLDPMTASNKDIADFAKAVDIATKEVINKHDTLRAQADGLLGLL